MVLIYLLAVASKNVVPSHTAHPLSKKSLYNLSTVQGGEEKSEKKKEKNYSRRKKRHREEVTAKEILNDKIKTASYVQYWNLSQQESSFHPGTKFYRTL